MLQELKDKLAEYLVKRNCLKGNHRVTVRNVKHDEGCSEEYFCQSCGIITNKKETKP